MPVNRINVSVDYIFLKYENYCFDVQFFLKIQNLSKFTLKLLKFSNLNPHFCHITGVLLQLRFAVLVETL